MTNVDFSALELDKLTEFLMVSNNPKFLYENFRENYSVSRFSESNNAENIIQFVRSKIDVGEVKDIEELVRFYASIIALSFKTENMVRNYFSEIKESDLGWIAKIADIIIRNMIPVQIHNFAVSPSEHYNKAENSSVCHIEFNQKPKLVIIT